MTRARVVDAAKVAAWTLGLYVASEVARGLLASNPNAAAIAPAVATEWVSGRLGVSWSDPLAKAPPAGVIARRIGQGAAMGAAVALATLALAMALAGARVKTGPISVTEILFGAIVPVFVGMRHELLAHGLGLRIVGDVRPPVKVAALAALSAGLALGGGGGPVEVAVTAALGAATGLLWVRDRGAWRAVAAHASWLWITGTLLRGAVVEVTAPAGRFAGADGSPFTGPLAVAVLAGGLALLAWRVRPAPKAADAAEPARPS